jgi:hypothetical protein
VKFPADIHRPVAPHPRFVCVSRRRYRGEGLSSGNILPHHLKNAAQWRIQPIDAYDPIQQAWSIGRDVGVNDMIAARKVA